MAKAARYRLTQPSSFLDHFRASATSPGYQDVDLGDVEEAQAWSLVGLAALARRNGRTALRVQLRDNGASKFGLALGLEDVVQGRPSNGLGEPGRTARLRRVVRLDQVEAAAREIGELMCPDDEDSQKTIRYVLVELMRNAVQHSQDPKGGVVAAQMMNAGYASYPKRVLQVAVADTGIGLPSALRATYPLEDPEAAVVKALEPHVSGAFGPGQTGSKYNAGMGLFFISEMAKLTAGRMLLATRGATLWLRGNLDDVAEHHMDFLPGLEFPGTLVAFELPFGEPGDHDGLISVIAQRAKERTPQRDTSPWVRFEAAPEEATAVLVSMVAEDVERAATLSRDTLQPALFARRPVALDFRNMRVCTQSFLHALMFEAIRLSWATQTPIYIENAAPGVQVGVKLVDNYARGG